MRFEIELPDDLLAEAIETAESVVHMSPLHAGIWSQIAAQLPTVLQVELPAPVVAALAGPDDDLGVIGDAALVYLRAAARRHLPPKE